MRLGALFLAWLLSGWAVVALCAPAQVEAQRLRRLPPVVANDEGRQFPSRPGTGSLSSRTESRQDHAAPAPPPSNAALHRRVAGLEAELNALKIDLSPKSARLRDTTPVRQADFELEEVGPGGITCHECFEPLDTVDSECELCEPYRWNHHFNEILNRPRYPTVEWSGFLQLDTGWVGQDETNVATVGDFESSTGLRRVRLRIGGEARENATYVVDLDFAANGHPSFRDVMLSFHEVPVLQNLHFGYFQQPFGADALTSGRELLFLERPLPFAFDPFRQTGFNSQGTWNEENGTWAVSGFRFPTDEFGVNVGSSGGWAMAARATYLPIYASDGATLVHVGLDHSIGDPGDNVVRYQIQPGFFVTDPTQMPVDDPVPVFVDTGNIPTETFNLFNAELAGAVGPLLLQSEVRYSVIDQIGGGGLLFGGAYFQMGYVLTGERHTYDREVGIFERVVPTEDWQLGRGGGAWELALGWSYIDLNDKNIAGGRLQTLIAGVNWYIGPHARFVINVIRAYLDDPTFGPSQATIAALRTQAEF